MSRLGRRLATGLSLLGLQGCVSARDHCGLVACGVERDALVQVSAEQLSAPAHELQVYDIRHYRGATIAWRVRQGGQVYQCREARDPAAPSHVQFLYCRPAT